MLETRRDEVVDAPTATAVSIEWIEDGSSPVDTLIGEPQHAASSRGLRWLLVGGLLAFASLSVVAGLDSRSPAIDRVAQPEPADSTATTTTPTTTISAPAIVALEPAPASLLSGRLVAWVGRDRSLVVRDLERGTRIEVPQWASLEWPPLPETARLVGAENSTYVIDTVDPAQSGQISGSVRMVRFGFDLDRFGYLSTNRDGSTDFFVGSIWGPSSTGLANTAGATSVFPVSERGVVISSPDARSSTLSGFGFRALPSRIGRVVAASAGLVAGIHCDEPGRCVGRVSDWEGANERQIPVDVLAREVVRLSPDGRYVLGSGGGEWVVYDFATQESTTFAGGVVPDATATWTEDSEALIWVDLERIVVFDVGSSEGPLRVSGRLGDDELPLAGTEIVALENRAG